MKKYKAVLFDYDGVVADTMEDNYSAWKSAFKSLKIRLKRDDYFPLEGKAPIDIARIILERNRSDISQTEKIAHLKHDNYVAITKVRGVSIYPYIERSLVHLKRVDASTALVTGAARKRLEHSIPALLELFDYVVAADDTIDGKKIQSKPSPDPFLVAAKKLSVSPTRCIVIENAPLGIESAKAAGCFCIALMSTLGRNPLEKAGADIVFQSHKNLLEYFKSNI